MKLFTKTKHQQGNRLRLLLILLLVAIAIFMSIKLDFAEVESFLDQNRGQAYLISLAVYILFGFTFLPSIPLTLFLAILIGPLQAAVIAGIGNTLAAMVEYQIGKTVGDVMDFETKKSKLPIGLGKLPIDSPVFMLAARAVPAGTRAYSMVCGAYQVPLPTYAWTSFLMFLVNSTALTFLGARFLPWIG